MVMLFRYSEGLIRVVSSLSSEPGNRGGTNGKAGVAPALATPLSSFVDEACLSCCSCFFFFNKSDGFTTWSSSDSFSESLGKLKKIILIYIICISVPKFAIQTKIIYADLYKVSQKGYKHYYVSTYYEIRGYLN